MFACECVQVTNTSLLYNIKRVYTLVDMYNTYVHGIIIYLYYVYVYVCGIHIFCTYLCMFMLAVAINKIRIQTILNTHTRRTSCQ